MPTIIDDEPDLPPRPTVPYLNSFILLFIIFVAVGGVFWPLTAVQIWHIGASILFINLGLHLIPYSLICRALDFDLSVERLRFKVGKTNGYPWIGIRFYGVRVESHRGPIPEKASKSNPSHNHQTLSRSPASGSGSWLESAPVIIRILFRRTRTQLVSAPLTRLYTIGRILAPASVLFGIELADIKVDQVALAYAHARLHVVSTRTGLLSLTICFDGLQHRSIRFSNSIIDIRLPYDEKTGLSTMLQPNTVEIAISLGDVCIDEKPNFSQMSESAPSPSEPSVETFPHRRKTKKTPSKLFAAVGHVCISITSLRLQHDGVFAVLRSSRIRFFLGLITDRVHPHRDLYGEMQELAFGISARVGQITLDHEGATRTIAVRPSRLDISSTWLPPQFADLLRRSPCSIDPRDGMIFLQGTIGGLVGDFHSHELERFLASRKQSAQHRSSTRKSTESSKMHAVMTTIEFPQVIADVVVEAGHIVAEMREHNARIGIILPIIKFDMQSRYSNLDSPTTEIADANRSRMEGAMRNTESTRGSPGSHHEFRRSRISLLYFARVQIHVDTIAVEAGEHRIAELSSIDIACVTHIHGPFVAIGCSPNDMSQLDLASKDLQLDIVLDLLEVALWRPDVLGSLRTLLVMAQPNPSQVTETALRPDARNVPFVDRLPLSMRLYASLNLFRARIAGEGSPGHPSPYLRGLDLRFDRMIFECVSASPVTQIGANELPRAELGLSRDVISEEAKALALSDPNTKFLLVITRVFKFELAPIVDAEQSARLSATEMKRRRAPSILQPHLPDHHELEWELLSRARPENEQPNGLPPHQGLTADIFDLPFVTLRIDLRGPEDPRSQDRIDANIDLPQALAKVSMLHIYCLLSAVRAIRTLSPSYHDLLRKADRQGKKAQQQNVNRHKHSAVSVKLSASSVELFITLPHNVRLLLSFRHIELLSPPHAVGMVKVDSILLAGVSMQSPGWWEDLIRIYNPVTTWPSKSTPTEDRRIAIHGRTARIRIPYKYIVSEVIDNIVTMVKAIKQLVHECLTGSTKVIIEPMSERPKRLPTVLIGFDLFVIEAEDDRLETNLNSIWRAGTTAQLERLAMQAALERKIEILEGKAEADPSDSESANGSDDSIAHPFEQQGKDTEAHRLSAHQADGVDVRLGRYRVEQHMASEWIRRIRNARAEQVRREKSQLDMINERLANEENDAELPVQLLANSFSTPLIRAVYKGFNWNVSPPSCGYEEGLTTFMRETGGNPLDTKYSLYIPFHLEISFADLKIRLRDYPLPLMRVPMAEGGLEDRACRLASDLVIAEELRDHNSTRRVSCQIIPREDGLPAGTALLVPRSAMPTKFYGAPIVEVTSAAPVQIGWGNSMSPSIHDVARVVDTLTKVPADPSERIGFWDKARLSFHGSMRWFFDDKLPLLLFYKGSRDPYAINGYGAGFVMRWDGHVRLLLHCPNPEGEFLQFESDTYRLSVPNLRAAQDFAAAGLGDSTSPSLTDEQSREINDPPDDKTCFELKNGVRWGMRLDYERTCRPETCHHMCKGPPSRRSCRMFDLKAHHEVQTRTAMTMGDVTDSYAGFRSDFVHFSVSIVAPAKRNQPIASTPASYSSSGNEESNSLHLSPFMSDHFWSWWRTFDSTLSLPIRQGHLFPQAQTSSKKFGNACATIKYRIAVAPLYIAHTYRQERAEDWNRGQTTVIGLKARFDHFNLDLHQRATSETHIHRPDPDGEPVEKTVMHKIFYQAELDCQAVDVRVISACFSEPSKAMVARLDSDVEDDEMPYEDTDATQLSEEDRQWVDLNDFTDVGVNFADEDPVIRLLPVMTCPHITYYRQPSADEERKMAEALKHSSSPAAKRVPQSKFGDEDTHVCLVGKAASLLGVRQALYKERENAIKQLQQNTTLFDRIQKAYLDVDATGENWKVHERAISRMGHDIEKLEAAMDVDDGDLNILEPGRGPSASPPYGTHAAARRLVAETHDENPDSIHSIFKAAMTDWERYGNRLLVHNPCVRINNLARDILLGYIYSRRERKAESYQMTAGAVRQIRRLAAQQDRSKVSNRDRNHLRRDSTSGQQAIQGMTQKVVEGLLNDKPARGNAQTSGDEGAGDEDDEEGHFDLDIAHAGRHLAANEKLENSFVALFICPQIMLRSEVDASSEVVVGAFHASLKVFSVVDQNCLNDPINHVVHHSSYGILKGLQVFCPKPRTENVDDFLPTRGFVPTETILDPSIPTVIFDRLMPAVDTRVRYDKYNQLRIAHSVDKDGADVGDGQQHDRFGAECLRFLISATPGNYAAIYNVVTDLVLYTDPAQRARTVELEALLLVDDFSDIQALASRVREGQAIVHLQKERLRVLSEQHSPAIGWSDPVERFTIMADHLRASRNLRLLIQAITATQARQSSLGTQTAGAGLQMSAHAEEIEWEMLQRDYQSIAQLIVADIDFAWRSRQDNSVSNELSIGDLTALNSHGNAAFPEILAKLEELPHGKSVPAEQPFCTLLWSVSPPVGGISVVEKLEINLHPIRLAIEHNIGRLIMDYVFSSQRNKSGLVGGESPKKSRRSDHSTSRPHSLDDSSETANSAASQRSPSPTRASKSPSKPYFNENDSLVSIPMMSSTSTFSSRRSSRMHKASVGDLASRYRNNADGLDVDEMRRRRALYRAFIYAVIDNTTITLSYKNNGKSKLPDLYGLSLNTPSFIYRNETLSYLDLLNHVKKDVTLTAWKQSASLVKQVITHARKPGTAYLELGKRAQIAQRRLRSRLHSLDWSNEQRSPSILQDSSFSAQGRLPNQASGRTGQESGELRHSTSSNASHSDRARSPFARASGLFHRRHSANLQLSPPSNSADVSLGMSMMRDDDIIQPVRSEPLQGVEFVKHQGMTFSSSPIHPLHSIKRSASVTSPNVMASPTAAASLQLDQAIQSQHHSIPSTVVHAPVRGVKAVTPGVHRSEGPHTGHHRNHSEDEKARLLLGRSFSNES